MRCNSEISTSSTDTIRNNSSDSVTAVSMDSCVQRTMFEVDDVSSIVCCKYSDKGNSRRFDITFEDFFDCHAISSTIRVLIT